MPSKLPRVNKAEESFLFQCTRQGIDFAVVRNHRFHPERRWTIDFAWPYLKLAVEIQGGIWIGGAHARPSNIERDMEKHNALLDLGWRCYQFTPKQVKAGVAVQHIERVLLSLRRGEPCLAQSAHSDRSGASSAGSPSSQLL